MIKRVQEDGGPAARGRLSQEDLAALAPKRTPRREVQVGVFVLVGIVAIVIMLLRLTDPGLFRGRYYVTTDVADAQGIRRGDPVRFLGVNIGRVRSLDLIPGQGVRLRLELEREYAVPVDSRVALEDIGLLGDKAAVIYGGASAERADNGDVLAATEPPGGLSETAAQLGERADSLLISAQALLNQQTIEAVNASAQDLQRLMADLAGLAGEQRRQMVELNASFRRTASNLEGATAGLEANANRPELAAAIARTDSITRRLDAALAQLNTASGSLATVAGRIERGEGSLGLLTQSDSLYNNLNAAVTSINALTTDIRENPKRYVNISVF